MTSLFELIEFRQPRSKKKEDPGNEVDWVSAQQCLSASGLGKRMLKFDVGLFPGKTWVGG